MLKLSRGSCGSLIGRFFYILSGLLILSTPVFAQTWDQEITLNPGWNAIYLEVQPEANRPGEVFAGHDIEAVWTWAQRRTKMDFIQDPTEGLWNKSGWLVWVPENAPAAMAVNLYRMFSGKSYLVNYAGQQPVTLVVSGVPSVDKIKWVPDSYNLVGFHLDREHPPTFANFFSSSEAHQGNLFYRLGSDGRWVQVNPAQSMRAGESYWIYTQGESSFNGPLMVELPGASGMDFNSLVQKAHVHVKNIGAAGNITFEMLSAEHPVPLHYRQQLDDEFKTEVWPQFEQSMVVEAPTDHVTSVQFSVDRANLSAHETHSILEIRDNAGSRWLVPVRAEKRSRTAYGGLWVGLVRVSNVSQSQLGSLEPEPVHRPFTFRIIIHVDGDGQARLLKEVIQLWEDGTYTVVNNPDPGEEPLYEVDQPGRYVLITDDSLVPQFQGAGQSDGEPLGYRISTAAYDFEGTELSMSGSFDFLRSLTVQLTVDPDLPTNPFKHKYHPDHNNLDEHYLPLPEGFEEALRIVRHFQLDFAELDPEGVAMDDGSWSNKPGWGSTIMGGTFTETITGLHKNDIAVSGTFRLKLVSSTEELNAGGAK
ncbi:MAG: hypothetical protein CR997_03885 [Acidobacteria bacterium]|nr:MAG: hypothetical protein CR997_03885 [Acidobacteriota bacterium]